MIGGRYLIAAALLGAMIIIPYSPIGVWLTKTFGPKPDFTDTTKWTAGTKTKLKLTLITADANRLACAHEQAFGEIHCGYKSEKERWPRDPSAPLDDNNANVIQPYRTSPDNKFVMVSGVWAQPKVAWRLHREPPQGTPLKQLSRFVVRCDVTFLGRLDNVKTRWAPAGRWQAEKFAMVARADSCDVFEE